MTRLRHRVTLLTAALLLAGCGSNAGPNAEQFDLGTMDAYGCGFGFWLGSPDQEVAVRLAASDPLVAEGELPQEATLPDDAWNATVLVGEDLYANWCDDVLEPDEPEPQVAEEWPITAGTITLDGSPPGDVCPHEARATVTGLQATRSDGTTVDLGDRDLVNDAWGCFAG